MVERKGSVVLRGMDGGGAFWTYHGEFIVDQGGVWLNAPDGSEANNKIRTSLGKPILDGTWLFLPLSRILAAGIDMDPRE